jgi:hypothetical protein
MKVEQIYDIVNKITAEVTGKTDLVQNDLTNVVDVGKEIFDAGSVDSYVKKLINHIGKVVFVNRKYSGRAPSVLMDGWEYGAILEKIDCGIPDAEENPHWKLSDGQIYEQDKFSAPKDVTSKFFKDRVTFQVLMSFAEDLVKQSFSNVGQLNAFFSMIYTKIENSFTLKLDGLIMNTINNFIAAAINGSNSSQKINLLAEFKEVHPDITDINASNCIYNLEFIKYAAFRMKVTATRISNYTQLFNLGKKLRCTNVDMLKIIMLDVFAEAANVYLQSDTFHNEFVTLPSADKVSFWQGTGTNFDLDSVSKINVQITNASGESAPVEQGGILAVMFDREALGVNNFNRRVTSHYNAPGEFINNWYKMDSQYFNDYNEQFIVFYVAD